MENHYFDDNVNLFTLFHTFFLDSESDGPESPVSIKPGVSKESNVHRKLFGK